MVKKASVLVAMSGGVDSSVAAALCCQQGYDVSGVFMCLGQAQENATAHPGCCNPQDARDAQQVARQLGIKFSVLDFQAEIEKVVEYFIEEYRNGRTPNPCIMCNNRLKFGKLIDYAANSGIDYVATGHYGRICLAHNHTDIFQLSASEVTANRHENKLLCRGIDNSKDQSYALFGIGRENLAKVILPVGSYTKSQVRQLAKQMNLPVHDKGESQEICFVPDDDYVRFITERAPQLARPGPVVDTAGNILGQHEGVFRYTIGQRRGLSIAMGTPAYVVRISAADNTVVLGSREDLQQRKLWADKVTWLIETAPAESFDANVQIRYNHRGAAGRVTPVFNDNGCADSVMVEFDEPIAAITPGQAVVFYDGEVVLGGGWISRGE
jgi:tRNA-uridine 2-sulfurtransferase